MLNTPFPRRDTVRSTHTPKSTTHAITAALATAALSLSLGSCSLLDTSENSNPSTDGNASAQRFNEGATGPDFKGTELPIDTTPAPLGQGGQGTCPYIDGAFLEQATGQRLTGTGLDQRFDPPACIFWSFEDTPQATVMVRHMLSEKDAVAVVDHAAPIDSTLKAVDPEGWSGGRRGGEGTEGALYAVWKNEVAVVVTTAQGQSIKAQQIAEEAIKNLGL